MRRLFIVFILFTVPLFNIDAVINPQFTPIDLMKQADTILILNFTDVDEEGAAAADIKEVLKGKSPGKKLEIELYVNELLKEHGDSLKEMIENGHTEAVFFSGRMKVKGTVMANDNEDEEEVGFLQIGNKWYTLNKFEDALWDLDQEEVLLLGTWSGGTDMFIRAMKAHFADPEVYFPINSGRVWRNQIEMPPVKGIIHAVDKADIDGDGKAELFLACEGGDQLLRWDRKEMKNITAEVKLSSQSHMAVWGDFDGNGLTDLASWDSKSLSIFAQHKDGFKKLATLDKGLLAENGCKGLTTLDSGVQGRPAILAGAGNKVVIITLNPDNTFAEKTISPAEPDGEKKEEMQHIFCADLDNDSYPDILQVFRTNSLFYKGTKAGGFDSPVKAIPACGGGRTGACLGDYDADGLPDVCTVGGDGNHLYQNHGSGNFVDSMYNSGEIYYNSKQGATDCWTADVNNDGKQDIFILYNGIQEIPQVFFNRGFRSFGRAWSMDIRIKRETKTPGQRTGCSGDFDNDGALDACIVLPDNSVWMLFRKMEEDPDLAVFAGLSATSPFSGPVNVSASQFGRSFGVRTVRAGQQSICFGTREPGPVILKWQFPGQKPQEKEVVPEDGAVYVFLDK